MMILLLLSFLIDVQMLHMINFNLKMWLLPKVMMVLTLAILSCLIHYVSRVEEKLDNKLLLMYSYSEVSDYIDCTEKYLGGGCKNKSRALRVS